MFQKGITIADVVLLENLGEHILAEGVIAHARRGCLFWFICCLFGAHLGLRFCWLLLIYADAHGDHQGGSKFTERDGAVAIKVDLHQEAVEFVRAQE